MKIGILTQPLGVNYGGILQNYALQTVLRRMGHEPVTLRVGKQTYWRWLVLYLKYMIKMCLGRIADFPETPAMIGRRTCGMETFMQRQMNVSPQRVWYLRKDIEKFGLECLLVGSDQVWRPRYNRFVEDLFFRFAYDFDIPKVAYAASFGASVWEFSSRQTATCRELVKQFRAVSVREESGVTLCREHLGYDRAEWVLDPVFLLSRSDYETLCMDEPKRSPFVFAYVLDMNDEKRALCERIAQQKGLPLQLVSAHQGLTATDSPQRWLASFRDTAYVVTDSFHGTAFSIIFHRDFLTLYNAQRGNARFDSLVNQFGIAGRVVEHPSAVGEVIEEVEWDKIDEQWTEWKKRSMRFLSANL